MNKKFILANQNRVKDLEPYIDRLLLALDCEGALVTDESELYDFMNFFMDAVETEMRLETLSSDIGVYIQDEYELMVDVAQKIKDKDELVA